MRDSDENKLRRNAHIRNKFQRSPFVCLGDDTSGKELGLFTLRVRFTNFMQATIEWVRLWIESDNLMFHTRRETICVVVLWKILLKWALKKWCGRMWAGFIWLKENKLISGSNQSQQYMFILFLIEFDWNQRLFCFLSVLWHNGMSSAKKKMKLSRYLILLDSSIVFGT